MTRYLCFICALACPVFLFMAGCDGGSPDAVLDANTFTVSAAGEDGGPRSPAFYMEGEEDGEVVFSLVLGVSDPNLDAPQALTQAAVVLARSGPTPGEGTYPLVDVFTADPDVRPDSVVGAYFVPDTTRGFRIHFAERGTLFVDEVQARESIQGRFEMTVREADLLTLEPVGPPVTVEGEFHAVHREAPGGEFPGARLPAALSTQRAPH
ncbi:MAG TPA: hypothetical protein VK002_03380 [Rubricoccaceae bacterium]|nr:hypothetical protein [Rubricoccaceae bacterium]